MTAASKTLAWLVNRLDAVGGGERLLLEGVKHYRALGYRVVIFTWFFNERSLFDGAYENRDIVVLETTDTPRNDIIGRAASRLQTLGRLRRLLKEYGVSTLFVQGEYDVALAYIATLFTSIRYRFLIFGQIFQYPHDHAKYSLALRRHLQTIVASRPGYAATIPIVAPKLGPIQWIANELICAIRRLAVHNAERLYSFSRQIQWETELLFGRRPRIARGAFPSTLLGVEQFPSGALDKYGLRDRKYILSLSRLDAKKRIDLIIESFLQAGLDDVVLVIGGVGPEEAKLRNLAQGLGAGERVAFIGLVDEQDLIPLKHYAALFVSMDIGDYDISPLEALAVGTPVICPTDFDADDQLLAAKGVSIVKPQSPIVAQELKRLMNERPRVDRAALRSYTWEAYFDDLLAN